MRREGGRGRGKKGRNGRRGRSREGRKGDKERREETTACDGGKGRMRKRMRGECSEERIG